MIGTELIAFDLTIISAYYTSLYQFYIVEMSNSNYIQFRLSTDASRLIALYLSLSLSAINAIPQSKDHRARIIIISALPNRTLVPILPLLNRISIPHQDTAAKAACSHSNRPKNPPFM